jgi:hypothetical protein
MKILKFFLLWILMTIIMVFTWSIGAWLGNTVTQTTPPPIEDMGSVGLWVIVVSLITSLSWSCLFWSIRQFSGAAKVISIVLFLFATNFFLTQMETFFFSSSLSISTLQVISILIAGLVMVATTASLGMALLRKLMPDPGTVFRLEFDQWRQLVVPVSILSVIVYPLLYQVFGYYVAWQNENLRLYYSGSTELEPFFTQLPAYFTDGLYFFQVLRGFLWVLISMPLLLMLKGNATGQYLFLALLSALPAIQLFIPNPYMPSDIALSHFFETSASNIVWGLSIVFALRRSRASGKFRVLSYG